MFSQQTRNTVTALRVYGLAFAIAIIINLCAGCGDDGSAEHAAQDAAQDDTAQEFSRVDSHEDRPQDGSGFGAFDVADAVPDPSRDSQSVTPIPDAAIIPRDTLTVVVIPDATVPPSNACKYTWADDWMPDSVPCCHEHPATCASLFPQGSCKCPGALRCTINNFDAKPTPQPYHWRCKQ